VLQNHRATIDSSKDRRESAMLECKVYGANDLRVLDVPTPVPGEGEVLVKLGAAGICGSDMHGWATSKSANR
jgi:threonine dehydrogenase-like Zn-dependent dehydrogenase